MPRATGAFIRGGDANTGGGYGTINKSHVGADSKAEETWPYISLTDLERLAANSPDTEADSRGHIKKKKIKKEVPADNLQQLNYKPSAYVNGSTRGLTGIMSGMDPRQILEQLIDEVKPMNRLRKGDSSQNIFGQKPIGLGGVQPNAMSADPTTRTRPGQGLGSKQGWFSPHPPKLTDPSNVDHAYSLRDIADADEERPIRHARIERSRAKMKSDITKENIAILRSYVMIVSGSP